MFCRLCAYLALEYFLTLNLYCYVSNFVTKTSAESFFISEQKSPFFEGEYTHFNPTLLSDIKPSSLAISKVTHHFFFTLLRTECLLCPWD